MSSLKKPGTYEFLEFKISPVGQETPFIDIRGLIHEWELIESMDSGHLHGSATVYDSIGLLDDFVLEQPHPWIKGEEQIKITYSDYFVTQSTQRTPITHLMFLYAVTDVTDVSNAQSTTRQYKIHFTSIDKFLTERFKIRSGLIDGLINDYVRSVFDSYYKGSEYYSGKPISVYDTEGRQNLVVPNYSPEQTMHFLARKAYSSSEPSQTWRFFENREKYFFGTHENLAGLESSDSTIVGYQKVDQADKTPQGNLLLQQSILDISYPVYINTFEDMIEGAYYSSLTELDFINRSPSFVEFRYLDDYNQYSYWPGNQVRSKHTKRFVDKHMSLPRDGLVIKDYGSPNDPGSGNFVRPETFYPQLYNQKRVNLHHHNSQSFTVKVYGNNRVMAGSIIRLNLEKIDSRNANQKDSIRTGRYLVEKARNFFSEEMYYQILTVSNSGFIGEKEPGVDYNRERQALSSYTERFDLTVSGGNENISGGTDGVDGIEPGETDNSSRRKLTNAEVDDILDGESPAEARKKAEAFLGREMSNAEWDNLVAATVAESLPNSPEEQAAIMGVILNRTRSNFGGYGENIIDQLNAKNQFQAVTGAAGSGPSPNFLNPSRTQMASTIDGVNNHLGSVDKGWSNFTSNITAAYTAGTNIGFRDAVRNSPGSRVIGGTVFGTVR